MFTRLSMYTGDIYGVCTRTHRHTHASTTLASHVRQAIKIKAPQKISSVSTGKLLFYLFLNPSAFSAVHPPLSNLPHISLIEAFDKRSTDKKETER